MKSHFLGDHPLFQIETDPKLLGQRSRKLIVKHITSEDEIKEEPLDLEQSDDDMDDDSDEVADDFEVKTDRDL